VSTYTVGGYHKDYVLPWPFTYKMDTPEEVTKLVFRLRHRYRRVTIYVRGPGIYQEIHSGQPFTLFGSIGY